MLTLVPQPGQKLEMMKCCHVSFDLFNFVYSLKQEVLIALKINEYNYRICLKDNTTDLNPLNVVGYRKKDIANS